MAAEWSPISHAHPVEFLCRVASSQPPYAVIRELSFTKGGRTEVYFRAVTFATESSARKLIGYTPTLEAGAVLAWDYMNALNSLRHHYAARRTDITKIDQLSEDPAALVAFYRQHRVDESRRKGA